MLLTWAARNDQLAANPLAQAQRLGIARGEEPPPPRAFRGGEPERLFDALDEANQIGFE